MAALHGNSTYCSDAQKGDASCHFRHGSAFPSVRGVPGVQGGYANAQVSLVDNNSGSVHSRAVCQVTSLGESVGTGSVFDFPVWLSHLHPKCVGLGSKIDLSEKSNGKQYCKKKLNSNS